LLASLVAVNASAQDNLLSNGDFEGISSLAGFWAPTADVWGTESGALTPGFTPGNQVLQINHAGGGGAAQTHQMVEGPFLAGSEVTFTAKFNGINPSYNSFAISISTRDSISTGDLVRTDTNFTVDANPFTWETFSVTTVLASDTNVLSAELVGWQDSNGSKYGIALAQVDDAVLTVTPPAPPPGHINWADWQNAATQGAVGTITTQTDQVVVNYVNTNGYAFAQLGNDAADYWTDQSRVRNAATSTFTSEGVTNIPTNTDIIGLRYAGTQTLQFDKTVANLVFAYVSLNGNGYAFDQDFEILSYGHPEDGNSCGYWGCGTSHKEVVDLGNGVVEYRLLGTGEPHGTIRFLGAFDTISWRSMTDEWWNGFTVGIQGTATEVTTDTDGDGILDTVDNCPVIPNGDQDDFDFDGLGDVCDPDIDGDGVLNDIDAYPYDPTRWLPDADGDGVNDDVDNCPMVANADQADNDLDGIGDVCDPDDDNDGLSDEDEAAAGTDPFNPDTDGDGQGDATDPYPLDFDNDGIPAELDNCPVDTNADQADFDSDGAGDVCDPDDDNDGVLDENDAENKLISGTVIIEGNDSGVADRPDANGVALSSLVEAQSVLCGTDVRNHGAYVSCMAHFLEDLEESGLITDDEKDALQSAAARTSIGKKEKGEKKDKEDKADKEDKEDKADKEDDDKDDEDEDDDKDDDDNKKGKSEGKKGKKSK